MKRRSVLRAYENIRPDEEAKSRMLRNILDSSEIPPAGKDDTMKHKKMRRSVSTSPAKVRFWIPMEMFLLRKKLYAM